MRNQNVRKLTITAMLSAVATVLMFLSFSVPFMPSFIKLDFSELPALIAAYTLGPVSGVVVCLIKNLINLFFTTTGGVGELSNFILGATFVFTAGVIFKTKKTYTTAFVGSIIGAAVMAIISVFSNYYIVYPIYTQFMPMEAIIDAYKALFSGVDNLWDALLIFNMPFTFLKGLISAIFTILTFKKLTPIFLGNH